MRTVLSLAAMSLAMLAQPRNSGDAPVSFEVATVKPAKGGQQALNGAQIGMSSDGARVSVTGASLAELVGYAYGVHPNQVQGPPWLSAGRFDIVGKIPDGVHGDKVSEMLQSLLIERFKMTARRETIETPIYALVLANDGPKLKASIPPTVGPGGNSNNAGLDGTQATVHAQPIFNGATITDGSGATSKMSIEDGHMIMTFPKATIAELVNVVWRFLDRPIVDFTGLSGSYEMRIDISMQDMMARMRRGSQTAPQDPTISGPRPTDIDVPPPVNSSIFSTLQKMGLHLEARKAPLEFVVLEHIDKVPTEN